MCGRCRRHLYSRNMEKHLCRISNTSIKLIQFEAMYSALQKYSSLCLVIFLKWIIVKGNVDGTKYRAVSEENLFKSARDLRPRLRFMFQLDNDPKHTNNHGHDILTATKSLAFC